MTETDTVQLWGVALSRTSLSEREEQYIASLPAALPTIEWVWAEMDRVWRSLGLNNRCPLSEQPIETFYRHPVWLMNGVFTAVDPESTAHRRAIAKYISRLNPRRVVDYGGGFGELALAIHRSTPSASISVLEPHPSAAAVARVSDAPNVGFESSVEPRSVDVLIAQDVLEHVETPISLAGDIAGFVRKDGMLIFANHFAPAIECHLPINFHLRHTFVWVMRALGLRFIGTIEGAPHAQVFEVPGPIRPRRARLAVGLSKSTAPLIALAELLLNRTRHARRHRAAGADR